MARKEEYDIPRAAEPGGELEEPVDSRIQHEGSSVKQGLKGGSYRAQERGRDEFQERGEAAVWDETRAEAAGRHYGRSGDEQPGPGYGRGPLQPAGRTEPSGMAKTVNSSVDNVTPATTSEPAAPMEMD